MSKFKDTINSLKNNPELSLKEVIGFSSGQFGNAMGQDTVGTYAEQFMYDYMGIPSDSVIALQALSKGADIAVSPFIGMLLDRNRSEKGNARKFMLFSSIPMTIASVMLFVVPEQSITFRIVWTFILFLTFNIADAFFDISLMALSTRMTANAKVRKNFYTVANFASSLGSMLPGWILPIIVEMQGDNFEAERVAHLLLAIVFGILGLITMLVPCFSLKEQSILVSPVKEKSVKLDLKMILLNKPLLLLCASQVVDSIRQVCYKALPFFYKQTLNHFSMKSIVDVGSGTLAYLGLASVPIIAKKLSARDIISFGYFHTGICYILLAIFGYKSHLFVEILIAIAGMPNYAMSAARKIHMADSTDYMEWKSYKKFGTAFRSDGMVFSFNKMTSSISDLWKDLIVNVGLKLIGYKSASVVDGKTVEAVQTPETLKGIFLLVVIPGIIGNILPGLILRFDDFNGKKRKQIYAELDEIRKAQQEKISETVNT